MLCVYLVDISVRYPGSASATVRDMCDVNVDRICHLEVMRSATPHIGVEPSVGAQNVKYERLLRVSRASKWN